MHFIKVSVTDNGRHIDLHVHFPTPHQLVQSMKEHKFLAGYWLIAIGYLWYSALQSNSQGDPSGVITLALVFGIPMYIYGYLRCYVELFGFLMKDHPMKHDAGYRMTDGHVLAFLFSLFWPLMWLVRTMIRSFKKQRAVA